ncbi:MAG: HdeD family acid-resistance protein [Methanothrix sp.]
MTDTIVKEASLVKADLIPWWLVLLEGLAALIIGIYLIISPVSTTIFLVQILGLYWLIIGILTIITIFMDRTDWIWRAVSGILGILAGLLIFGHPLLSALLVPETVILIGGILGVCFGFSSLFWAMKEGWGTAIMGVLSIIFGLLLIGSPIVSVVMLVYLLAYLGIIGGFVTIYLALKLRSM